jgi:hypothetical protein
MPFRQTDSGYRACRRFNLRQTSVLRNVLSKYCSLFIAQLSIDFQGAKCVLGAIVAHCYAAAERAGAGW